MKIFKKADLRARKQVERTMTERDILSAVRWHPFIVQLSSAFQTEHKLYMVMDFVQGGDFFTLLRKLGKMEEAAVALYSCEIALALQHLHDLDVVYRDLKPENVLMDSIGHVKLTDFGLSRSFETRPAVPPEKAAPPMAAPSQAESTQKKKDADARAAAFFGGAAGNGPESRPKDSAKDSARQMGAAAQTTKSYCGTEQYMAPEMLLQRGHDKGVDWWCLGLLVHEMLTGRHPFQGHTHYETLRAMVSAEPKVDPRMPPSARSLVRRLLIKDPRRRMGARGLDELRPHPFFQSLDWEKVERREVTAPYIPAVSGETGTENFEDVFTREKPVDSVAEPTRGGRGLLSGLLGFGGAASRAQDDTDFEGFSFHGDPEKLGM